MDRINMTDRTEYLERKYRRPICGAWLPNVHDHCVRHPHHKWDHKSEYTMENARIARSGWQERTR
jgi:hypothetical protein